jgi:hypothetical protein
MDETTHAFWCKELHSCTFIEHIQLSHAKLRGYKRSTSEVDVMTDILQTGNSSLDSQPRGCEILGLENE